VYFRHVLAHELAHAFCDLSLRHHGCWPAIWANEGYAHFLATACWPDSQELQQRYLAYYSWCYKRGNGAHLHDLLLVERHPDDINDTWRLHCHAAVFVRFLHSFRRARPQAWAVLRAALAGRVNPPEQAITLFEQAFGTSLEKIEAQFIDYCIDEAKRLNVELTDRVLRIPTEFYWPRSS
jgi:hypothetical protein